METRIIGINEEKKQVRLSMRSVHEPPGASEQREFNRKQERTKQAGDPMAEEDTGHESLSMRDLLGNEGLDEDTKPEEE